ncbi:hypothetical protein BX666DRAFT_2031227 [Dichotomocladium elegans]|nr:hypothetical protein BX666DRAFT_2031227 [Dichotomocladium elegans]
MGKTRATLSKYKKYAQGYVGTAVLFADAVLSRRRLYKNPNFWLIHVVNTNEEGLSMKIVCPATDRDIRKQLKKEDFYTVSHIWDGKNKREMWTTHGILDAEGNPAKAMMRPEKQKTLLALLKSRPGFWWIDVFCYPKDTPLVIMGDIYRLCRRCYALIDLQANDLKRIKSLSEQLESFDSDALSNGYKEQIAGKSQEDDITWDETMNDLLGWCYDVEPDDIKALVNFTSCQWFKRVWTLQEFILPNLLSFISEDGSPDIFLDRYYVTLTTHKLACAMEDTLESYLAEKFSDEFPIYGFYFGLSKERMSYITSAQGVSRCYQDLTRFSAVYYCFPCFINGDYEVHDQDEVDDSYLVGFENASIRVLKLRYMSSKFDLTGIDLARFGEMPRVCTDPCDYIYGVAGLLDLDIPRVYDHRKVWAAFIAAVQERVPEIDIPLSYDLSKAKSMQDVYKFVVHKNPEQLIKRGQKVLNLRDMVGEGLSSMFDSLESMRSSTGSLSGRDVDDRAS